LFNVSIDLSALKDLGLDLDGNLSKMAYEVQQQLAIQTYSRIEELAGERLHTRKEMFIENLQLDEGEPGGEAVITLLGKAVWIDEGLPQDYLWEALLSGPKAKPGKNGSTYAVVPFNSGPNQSQANLTDYNKELVAAAKEAFKKKKIPWAKISKDDQGRPILGKIASVKGLITPNKMAEGFGQGQGPIGEPRQGHTGKPYLEGAAIYQREVINPKDNKAYAKRYVLTFRTASSAHPEKWHHPGLEPTNLMEAGYDWAMEQLETEILPKLFNKYFNSQP
jgi:hypothetical protein